MKIIIYIKEINGEYEYLHRVLMPIELPEEEIPEMLANWIESWYEGRLTYVDNDYYFFNGGEVAVKISSWKVITEEDYKILSKHLYS